MNQKAAGRDVTVKACCLLKFSDQNGGVGRGEPEKAKRYAVFSVYTAIALVIIYALTIINKGLLMTPILILLANLYGLPSIPFSQIITDSVTAVILLAICLRIIRWKDHVGEKLFPLDK